MSTVKSLVILFLVVCLSQCSLKILKIPKNEKVLEVGNQVNYTVGNFGKIPYGKRLVGNVYQMDPLDGCTEPKLKKYNTDLLSKQDKLLDDQEETSYFILVKRGSCPFTLKSKNANSLGASLVIIYDNVIENSSYITMGDDGYGFRIQIPSIFIDDIQGEELKNAIDIQKPGDQLQLQIQFETQKTPNVNVTFFVLQGQGLGYTLLRELAQNWNVFGNNPPSIDIVFRFYYRFDLYGQSLNTDGCILNKYCIIPYDKNYFFQPNIQKEMIFDQIKVSCILENINDGKTKIEFLDYLQEIGELYPIYGKQRINEALAKFGLSRDKALRQCVDFDQDSLEEDANITVLDYQIEKVKYSGILGWPTVAMNNIIYQGNLDGDDITEAICAHFKNPTQQCLNFMKDDIKEYLIPVEEYEETSHTSIIVVIVIIVIIIFLIIFYFYRRQIHKDLKLNIGKEVSEQVNNYIAFYENEKSKSKIDQE